MDEQKGYEWVPVPEWPQWNRNLHEKCAFEQFFESQKKLPPHLRSVGALLVCFCRRCRPIY
jgi:hypothetical protein